MNLSDPHHPWSRLSAGARRHVDERGVAAPYGFATRVAALAMATERARVSLFERFSLRAMGVACLLLLGSLAANYSAISNAFAEEPLVPGDPVAELLDGSSS